MSVCSQWFLLPVCSHIWDCPNPCAAPYPWPWTSRDARGSISKACPSAWHPFLLLCQLLILSLVTYEERPIPTCLRTPFKQVQIRSSLTHLFSRLKNPSSLSCSLWNFCLKPFTRHISLLWTQSSTSVFLFVRSPKANTIFEMNIIFSHLIPLMKFYFAIYWFWNSSLLETNIFT